LSARRSFSYTPSKSRRALSSLSSIDAPSSRGNKFVLRQCNLLLKTLSQIV
jgi:hypothetical protein